MDAVQWDLMSAEWQSFLSLGISGVLLDNERARDKSGDPFHIPPSCRVSQSAGTCQFRRQLLLVCLCACIFMVVQAQHVLNEVKIQIPLPRLPRVTFT